MLVLGGVLWFAWWYAWSRHCFQKTTHEIGTKIGSQTWQVGNQTPWILKMVSISRKPYQISDLLFIEHVATSFSVILPPATSIWCISKPRDSKVLTLAASDDVSAVCGDDGCDGSQLMQSGFGKTTKIQGGPDRRPEALKDLADRLVQAKQDVGNWGVFGWGCCVTFLLSWRSFGKKLFLWEKSWPRFQAMMSALFDSGWPKGIWNSDDGGMFYTTDRHANCIQKWGPQMSFLRRG